jgi:hypothetical protein
MTELSLEARLMAVGESLEFARADVLVDDILEALEERRPRAASRWRRPLLAVAAVLLVLVAVTLAIPGSRRAVARWIGFDGYRIERVVDLPEIAATPPPVGPVVMRGDLTEEGFRKLVTAGTEVRRIKLHGREAFWISGDQHLFFSYLRDGTRSEQRLAGNTLVWQEGDQIVRVEGVALTLPAALEIAEDLVKG